MTLKELRKEMMLSKRVDPEKSKVLNAVLALSQLIAKEDGNRDVNDKDIEQAALKEIKMANQSKDSGAPYNARTFEVLSNFIPKELSEDEHIKIIQGIINELEYPNIGKIMKILNTVSGINKRVASGLVKKILKDNK